VEVLPQTIDQVLIGVDQLDVTHLIPEPD
jgi:hypothetical protein